MADTSFRGAVVRAEESVDAAGVDGRRILTQFARDVVPETSLDAHLNVGEVALERADLNELLRRRWLRRLVRDRRRIIRRCGNGRVVPVGVERADEG
jgi:hypothetical protein